MANTEVPTNGKVPGIRWSPTIELGHLLQAFVMIAGLGGWALVGYQTITKQLDQHASEMQLFKQRLEADEAAAAGLRSSLQAASSDLRNSLQTSSSETRQALSKVLDQIADLRALVAAQGAPNAPRR